ncbi:unnamed protein product [Trichogramma brassicae]|uniref:Uncharacterized protein n=1 Tax=Trichogramma brassicae TaxID=86971 RepID=A0A6H5IVM7_9HYME|nr:unnamed protein product [Trichogramma brassicae]
MSRHTRRRIYTSRAQRREGNYIHARGWMCKCTKVSSERVPTRARCVLISTPGPCSSSSSSPSSSFYIIFLAIPGINGSLDRLSYTCVRIMYRQNLECESRNRSPT